MKNIMEEISMAKIVGINSVNYIDKRKLESKLSFKEGEKFFAKVCSSNKNTGEVILKLPNGWEFKAELSDAALKDNMEFMEGKVLKFKVEDFSNGKIQLSLPEEISNEELNSSLKNILGRLNLPGTQENVELLEKMIKHDITLDKDNIFLFKNLMFIKQRINQGTEEIDNLTNLFLMKCNINEGTEESEFIKSNLREFFTALNEIDNDVLLSLKENNLDVLSKDNIKSMVDLNEGTHIIEKSIEEILQGLRDCDENNKIYKSNEDLQFNTSQKVSSEVKQNLNIKDVNMEVYKEVNDLIESDEANDIKKEMEKFLLELNSGVEDIGDTKEKKSLPIVPDNLKDKISHGDSLNTKENPEVKENLKVSKEAINQLSSIIKDNSDIRENIVKKLDFQKEFNLNGKGTSNNLVESPVLNLADIEAMDISQSVKKILINSLAVKETIGGNINEIKKLIIELMNIKENVDETSQKSVMHSIKESINNLKVINSITDQYYYLDTPLNINNKKHDFKLIIKNNNKKGHEFDTKCIKIFASIKGPKIGCVDNFITINNTNMQIRICCNKKYMKSISNRKSELIESISLIGYTPTVIVEERKESTNLSNSAEFFQEQTFTMINQLV